MHYDDNRWQTIYIENFLYVYGNRQAVGGHGRDSDRQSFRTSPLPFKPLSFDEEATAEAAARKKLISALGEKI